MGPFVSFDVWSIFRGNWVSDDYCCVNGDYPGVWILTRGFLLFFQNYVLLPGQFVLHLRVNYCVL